MAVELLRVTLPMPPTVNNLFRNTRSGRAVTDEYEAWRWEARCAAEWPNLTQYRKTPWEVTIQLYGLPRGNDADNRIKAAIDLIAALTGLRDDHVDAIALVRSTTGERRIVIAVSLIE